MLSTIQIAWAATVSNLPTVIAWIFVLTYIIVGLEFLFSMLTSIFYLYRKPKSVSSFVKSGLPGVSIVKPLMGVDSCLEGNLESHFTLKYEGPLELLICVEDPSDAALEVVARLRQKYPHVDVRIFHGPTQPIMNPMVRNMVQGYDAAKYDLIWICTSRVRVNDDIIDDLVSKMMSRRDMQLVHQMPYFYDAPSPKSHRSMESRRCSSRQQIVDIDNQSQSSDCHLTSFLLSTFNLRNYLPPFSIAHAIEKIYFGTAVPRSYFFLWSVGHLCFTGMSYMFRKSSLDRKGGLAYYGRYIAEDFYISWALASLGHHTISGYPALQNVGETTVTALKDRLVRWMRIRINTIPPISIFLEPMQECIPCGLALSWALVVHFQWLPQFSFLSFFLFHSAVWFVLEAVIFHALSRRRTSLGISFDYLLAWTLRQILCVYVFFETYTSPFTIRWGKGVYHISPRVLNGCDKE